MDEKTAGNSIFLSYASKDREAAARIAHALENAGFSVWWDKDIPTGVNYPKYIESALKSAGCVMVCWSHTSTESRWVRNEADWGAVNDTLVPVLIEDCEIPWEFRNIQTLNLADWTGDPNDEVFQRLMTGLQQLVSTTGEPPVHPRTEPVAPPKPKPKPESPTGLKRPGLIAGFMFMIILAALWSAGIGPFERGSDVVDEAGISYVPWAGGGITRASAISPDGQYLAVTPMADKRSGLTLSQIDTGSESVLVPMDAHGIRSPVFSPDGVYVYFAMAGADFSMAAAAPYDLYRITLLGGQPQKLVDQVVGRRFALSPDGSRMVYKRTAGDSTLVQTAATDGSDERTIHVQPRTLTVDCSLAWSAADGVVVTSMKDPESGHQVLVGIPDEGGEPERIGTHLWQVVMDVWALADGSGLLVAGMPVTEDKDLHINVWHLGPQGRLTAVTDDITYYYQVSADRSGDRLALTYFAASRTLRVADLEGGGRPRRISTDLVRNGRVVWPAPGRLLANQQVGNRIGIVQFNMEFLTSSLIPTSTDYVSELDMSRDGLQLAYTEFQGKDHTIWLAEEDGSSPRRLTVGEEAETEPQFTPDGKGLVYLHRAAPGEPWRVRIRSLEDGETRVVTETPARSPRLSPDGQMILAYFLDEAAGGWRPGIVPVTGGTPEPLDLGTGFRFLDWSADGEAVTCYSRGEGVLGLHDMPLDGSAPRDVLEIPVDSESITGLAWSTAGDSLAVCLQNATFDVVLVEGVAER